MKLSGYLAKRRAGFEAVVDVPPSLREAVGRKRLRKGLATQDIHVARARLKKALVESHARLDAGRLATPQTDPVTAEALAFREVFSAARQGLPTGLPEVTVETSEGAFPGGPDMGLLVDLIAERGAEIARSEGAGRAEMFAGLAFGRATPLAHYVEKWLAEPGRKGRLHERTKADYRALVAAFGDWLAKQRHPVTTEAVTRQVAGAYASALLAAGRSDARIRDICSALSGYWRWLEKRGVAAEGANPWPRQAPRKVSQEDSLEEPERAFTPEEMRKLLGGPADAALSDLMHIAALTGM